VTREAIKQAVGECLAIAAALLARPISSDVMALFTHESPDVRMAASMFLGGIDPKLAEATRMAVSAGCTADDVIAMRERIRKGPPSRPTLQEMSDEALPARYQDVGERLVGCRFIDWVHEKKDMDTRNGVLAELSDVAMEMKRRGLGAKLLPFLDSAEPEIRLNTALVCLNFAPERAVPTLEALEAGPPGHTCATAGGALDRWRARPKAADTA
jgi:hypothetical protein